MWCGGFALPRTIIMCNTSSGSHRLVKGLGTHKSVVFVLVVGSGKQPPSTTLQYNVAHNCALEYKIHYSIIPKAN